MANRTVYQRVKNLSPNKILRAYQVFGTCRKAARALGISRKTVERHLRKMGIELHAPGGQWMRGKRYEELHRDKKPYHYSCLANWIRENPDTPLPKSISAIVEMTGCSEDSVRAYLKRRGVKVYHR